MSRWQASLVNAYLAHKQHLLPTSQRGDVVQVTRDIVALHATGATVPYLSLWARVPGFEREMLDEALYGQRDLARVLSMRVTLHAAPSDELPFFHQACRDYVERRTPAEYQGKGLLVKAGLCPADEAGTLLAKIERQILDVLAETGPATLPELSRQVPELQAKMRHDVGKAYEGEFSIGSRLVSEMCAQGLLIRARPRGGWRSSLYEYAAFSDWLPGAELESVGPQEARAWLVRRYLAAFGPALFEDIQWWTGFTKTDTQKALERLEPETVELAIEGLDGGYLMLADDLRRLHNFSRPDAPVAFFLPGLDPYIMGYRDRHRFLAPEHEGHVLARAGNTVPTAWVNGRLAAAWGQRPDGSVVYRFFEPVGKAEQALVASEARRLEGFLAGEYLAPRYGTAFTRALDQSDECH